MCEDFWDCSVLRHFTFFPLAGLEKGGSVSWRSFLVFPLAADVALEERLLFGVLAMATE